MRFVFPSAIEPKAVQRVLNRDDCPAEVLQGVTRRLFSSIWGAPPAEPLNGPVFEKLANWALRHPSEGNRRETVVTLAAMKREDANRILVQFLHESPTPRKSAAPSENELEDPFSYPNPNDISSDPFAAPNPDPAPIPFIPPAGISELGAAALLLAQHGYPDALAEIQTLAAKTKGEERKLLEQAAAILAKPTEE